MIKNKETRDQINVIRLRCTAISVFAMLLSMFSLNGHEVNEENISEYLNSDCHSVAGYIDNNFALFVEKYNESSEEKLYASYVENSFDITIFDHEGEKSGVFLDFDKDNGYALVGDNYSFYDFSTKGDSPFLNVPSDSFFYSTINGYLYLKDGRYINVEDDKNFSEDRLEGTKFSSAYAGQDEAGCGHITVPYDYINDKYGTGWAFHSEKSVSMATGEFTNQNRLSCYMTNKIENNTIYVYGESNCWFVSAYNILQSLADSTGVYKRKVGTYKTDGTRTSMPKIKRTIAYSPSISEPDIYNRYFDSKHNNITDIIGVSNGTALHTKSLNDNLVFPELYTIVRKYVYSKFKKVDEGTVYDTADIINSIGKQYGYDFKAHGTVAAGLYGGSGITAINNNLPFALCVGAVSNGGYSDHIMAGCGYLVYSKTSEWWLFKNTEYRYLYELRDGHSKDKVYFDLSAWTGFGGVILLDYGSIDY